MFPVSPFLYILRFKLRALAVATTIRSSTLSQYVPNLKYLCVPFNTCPYGIVCSSKHWMPGDAIYYFPCCLM